MNDTLENTQPMVLIAYHANCIDGFTSAWVTAKAMRKRGVAFELIGLDYTPAGDKSLLDAIRNTYRENMEIYVVDFSLSLEMLETLSSIYPMARVTILDHHKTAFERYSPTTSVEKDSRLQSMICGASIILDNAESGASLCYKYFNQGAVLPSLIRYVKDYDLWQFKLGDETRWINKYLCSKPKNLAKWDNISEGLEKFTTRYMILEQGKMMQKAHDMEVAKIASTAQKINILGDVGLAVACPREFTSDVGHVLAKGSGTYGAMYKVSVEKEEVSWSLRSDGDYDVSAIAKKLGGGGHKNAAGFTQGLFEVEKEKANG